MHFLVLSQQHSVGDLLISFLQKALHLDKLAISGQLGAFKARWTANFLNSLSRLMKDIGLFRLPMLPIIVVDQRVVNLGAS